jgi:hypothetical protein
VAFVFVGEWRKKKPHYTTMPGCPSLITPDTSNHKPVSSTNDIHGQRDTGMWHQTPVSVSVRSSLTDSVINDINVGHR